MSFEKCFAFTIGEEGGYVNHPKDKGGETKWGISKNQYPNISIPSLTKKEANAIYFRDYWKPSGANLLPDKLAMVHFDSAINHGVTQAIKLFQGIVCAKQDGILGPKTLKMLEYYLENGDENYLVQLYIEHRKELYENIVRNNPDQKIFLKGWFNRINKLKKEVGLA